MHRSPFDSSTSQRPEDLRPPPDPFGASTSYVGNTRFGQKREIPELSYNYREDRSHRLLDTDLREDERNLSWGVSWACLFSAVLEFSILAWPITAFSVWGFRLDTIYTLVFSIHLLKGMLLLIKTCSNTLVFRMRGRNSYHWFWGIWTRVSHVHQDPVLLLYSTLYGWIQIPIMTIFILVSAASYPVYYSSIAYWINWPMAIVSLVVGYVAWCVIISERSIRMPLKERVDLTERQRKRTQDNESRSRYFRPTTSPLPM